MIHTLDVSNLRLEYGYNRVLWDTCLHGETGKVIGILGRNGGGKSCLMKVIYGELMLKDQYVAIDGKALLTRERRPGEMRYLLQQGFFPPGLTVRRVFDDFGVDFNRFAADFPEFEGCARKRMKGFSTGERRIVEVYAVLTAETKFCLLDEPFSFMMPLHVQKIKEVIRQEKARKGIVITDHFFEDVVEISDEVFVLRGGKTWRVNERADLELLEYIKNTDEIQDRRADGE